MPDLHWPPAYFYNALPLSLNWSGSENYSMARPVVNPSNCPPWLGPLHRTGHPSHSSNCGAS